MRALLSVAWHSAWHRRFGLSFVVLSVALATFLLLAVERVRLPDRAVVAAARRARSLP